MEVNEFIVFWVTVRGFFYADSKGQQTKDIKKAKTFKTEKQANAWSKKTTGGWAYVDNIEDHKIMLKNQPQKD